MHNVCNVRLPQAMGEVISSIGIGTAAADSIGRRHDIGLTLVETVALLWMHWQRAPQSASILGLLQNSVIQIYIICASGTWA